MDALDAIRRPLETLRRPEYTGERRCWPCTALNAAAVLAVAVAVGAAWPLAGLAVGLCGAALLALRGYVVPYTPRFGPWVAARLPTSFDHRGRSVETGSLADRTEHGGDAGVGGPPEAVLGALAEAGVLVELDGDAGDGQLALDDGFRATWEERVAALRSRPPADVASAAAAAAPWDATGEVVDDRVRVRGEGRDVWLSLPVAVAETAAVSALVDAGLGREVAATAAAPLRMFLETCPACGGPVVETTREHCCGGTAGAIRHPDTEVLACEDCGEELFVFEPVVEPGE